MKATPVPSASVSESPRCRFRTQNGQCRMLAVDFSSSLCLYHAQQALPQVPDTVDLLRPLTQPPSRFHSAADITQALSSLFSLLAQGRISSRRATALAYIANLLLHHLPDADREAPASLSSPNTCTGQSVDWPTPTSDASDPSAAEKRRIIQSSQIPAASPANRFARPRHSSPNPKLPPLPDLQPLPSTVEAFLSAVHTLRDTS